MNSPNELITQFNVNWNEDGTPDLFNFFFACGFSLNVHVRVSVSVCVCRANDDLHKMTIVTIVTVVIQNASASPSSLVIAADDIALHIYDLFLM